MKKNFYLNLRQEVGDILKKQQVFEEEFKTTVRDKVTRQVRLIDRNVDEEKMEEYVQNPQMAQEMLQAKIMGNASTILKNAVSDIQDKLRDIQRLEQSVEQCVVLFNELSALVFAQGEKIDSIEVNLTQCKHYVQKATAKLEKVLEHLTQPVSSLPSDDLAWGWTPSWARDSSCAPMGACARGVTS